MLIHRLLTALLGIPLVAFLVHSGGYFFMATILLLAGIAFFELKGIFAKKNVDIYLSNIFFVLLLCVVAFYYNDSTKVFLLFVFGVLCVLLQGILSHKQKNWQEKNLYSLFTLCYIGLFFSLFILLRQFDIDNTVITAVGSMNKGEVYFWLCLLGTWASDTFAYFAGTALGKHKLCPAISPNKSWEGAIAGFIGCIISVNILNIYVFDINHGVSSVIGLIDMDIFLISIFIAIFAPFGDLVESQLKRNFAVKDSGSIFPGHGGVLDRLDSLLLVIPIVYIYLNFAR